MPSTPATVALTTAVRGKRAIVADPTLAQRKTGYLLGRISPIGQKTTVRR